MWVTHGIASASAGGQVANDPCIRRGAARMPHVCEGTGEAVPLLILHSGPSQRISWQGKTRSLRGPKPGLSQSHNGTAEAVPLQNESIEKVLNIAVARRNEWNNYELSGGRRIRELWD